LAAFCHVLAAARKHKKGSRQQNDLFHNTIVLIARQK